MLPDDVHIVLHLDRTARRERDRRRKGGEQGRERAVAALVHGKMILELPAVT
jgi:hypothetical protein